MDLEDYQQDFVYRSVLVTDMLDPFEDTVQPKDTLENFHNDLLWDTDILPGVASNLPWDADIPPELTSEGWVNDLNIDAAENSITRSDKSSLMDDPHQYIRDKDVNSFMDKLEKHPTLTELSLDLSDYGAVQLAERILEKHPNLQNLDIKGNRLTDLGAIAIANSLEKNVHLKRIRLYQRYMSDKSGASFAKSLQKNTTLSELLLQGNIMDDGALAIASALEANTSLLTLGLFYGGITDVGACAFADLLAVNTHIRFLDLTANKITNTGACTLAASLGQNKALKFLSLQENSIGLEGLASFLEPVRLKKNMWIELTNQRDENGEVAKQYLKTVTDLQPIGSGAFGDALRGFVQAYGDDEKIECIVKASHDVRSSEIHYETLLLQTLPPHKNVLKLIGLKNGLKYNNSIRTVVALEIHKSGSMKKYINKMQGRMSLKLYFHFALGMASGIQHLHNHGILHRDIAARNFVISDNQDPVVIDFGCSCAVTSDDGIVTTQEHEQIPWRRCPPETLQNGSCLKVSDVWMLGITFWEMSLKEVIYPFHFISSLAMLRKYLEKKMVQQKEYIPLVFPREISPQIKKLVNFCCIYQHEDRPTIDGVIRKIESIIDGGTGTDPLTFEHDEKELNSEACVEDLTIYVGHDDSDNYVSYGSYIDLLENDEENDIDIGVYVDVEGNEVPPRVEHEVDLGTYVDDCGDD